MNHSASMHLAPSPSAPSEARAWAREVLTACEFHQQDEPLLLLSELVTNAVRHGSDPIQVACECEDTTVTFAVRDASPGTPKVMAAGIEAESGRGLHLVNEIAGSWGYDPHPVGAGKTVWFRLP